MKCPKCNNENIEGSIFCSLCGSSLNTVSPTTTTTNNNMSKSQKGIIIGLLAVIITILIVSILTINNGGTSLFKQKSKKEGTKTIMIYMAGSNLEADSKIATAELDAIDPSKVNLEKTNILLYTGGTEEWHNFVSNKENAIYKLTSNGFEKLEAYPKKNMGDASTLTEFLTYAYDNYKAGHFDLIMYNHGGAIDGAIYDDFTNDHLSLEDISKALNDSPFNDSNKMDSVIFRTCLNGTLEVANVFKNYSEYITFSEEVTLGSSMSNVLGYFINDIDPSLDGLETGKKFIDAYVKQMEEIDPLEIKVTTYSIIDLSKIDKLINELDNYITGIDLSSSYDTLSKLRAGVYQYGTTVLDYDTVDLFNFIVGTKDFSSNDYNKVLKAIEEAVIYNYSNLESSHGLSIYFPYRGRQAAQSRFINVYNKLGILDNYRKFIVNYASLKNGSTKYEFDLSKNEHSFVPESKEVTFELDEEQEAKYGRAKYLLFRRNQEHPNYYDLVYNSNDIDKNGNKLTTKIGNNLVKIKIEEDTMYMNITHLLSDNYKNDTSTAILYDYDKELMDPDRMRSATLNIGEKDGKPIIATAEMITRDERAEGIVYDINGFDAIDYFRSSFKLLDSNGKVMNMDDWETAPVMTGYSGKLADTSLEYSGMDDGEFYCMFILYDINNNYYLSDLIKVG